MMERVDPDNLPEGTMVDCWRVVRRLGGGAYGTVYLVEKDGELYALKLARFPRHSGDKRHTDERAQRELNCLLSLEHRHIVQARAYGRWPHAKTGFFYVVMDYVEGYTLEEWMERTHPTPHEVVVLFNKVFSAVAYAHAQGIFHRDLKPTNILVESKTGEPVVVDFGAAYFPVPTEPLLTDTRLPPGTPRYTSPEARRFESIHRGDPEAHYEFKAADELYALGVTLFDLLTDPLHHSDPKPEPLSGLDVPQAHEVNARVPRVLSQFAARLLQREPAKRPVSVEAARRELAELVPLQGEAWTQWPVHAPLPPSEAEEAEPQRPQASEPVASREEVSPEWAAPAEPPPQKAPPAETPPAAALPAAPPRRGAQRRAVAVGTLVLGLLLGWGAQRSFQGAAHPEEPTPAPAPTASLLPRQPLPQPLVAPPVSIPEKGTAVNVRSSSEGAVPSLCARKQPPPRGTPLWRRWCKCAAIMGSLAATQAGCPAVQVRQSLTEECSQESVAAMQQLGVGFWAEGAPRIVVELDVKQPNNGSNEPCGRDKSPNGRAVIACIQEGPLTSRVLQGSGKLVHGTLLAGQAWLHPPSGFHGPILRWTEATLPDGSKHPVCIETAISSKTCENGAAKECAAQRAEIVKRWDIPLTP